MTKLSELIEKSLDKITDELQRKENKFKIDNYIIDPILKELSQRIQPFFYLMLIMYLLLFVPLVTMLCIFLLKKKKVLSYYP